MTDRVNEKLDKILNTIGVSTKINYEQLKIYLDYEDLFYDLILKPKCEEFGFDISFDKEFVVLKKNK